MATINTTTEFVPEIWEQIKEYAGIYHISTNLIHFDKLTYKELVYNDDLFAHRLDINVYDTHIDGWKYFGGNWYDRGYKIVSTKALLYDFVREIKWGYKYIDPYHLEKCRFWTEISEIIAKNLKEAAGKKIAAAWRRKKNKEFKETVKGMTQDILDIEKEEVKLVIRMKKDAEKIKKLRANREKLEEKRRVKREKKHNLTQLPVKEE